MSRVLPKSEALGAVRIKAGLSLRGLALKTKVHYSTLHNAENGKGGVSPRVANAICSALKVNFDDLFRIEFRRDNQCQE